MTKLFVYGVNSRCPRDLLEDEFGRCGKVEDVYITGKGKCFSTLGYALSKQNITNLYLTIYSLIKRVTY